VAVHNSIAAQPGFGLHVANSYNRDEVYGYPCLLQGAA